ncbi:hypothetical protein Tco_0694018 [Tanacetum coccineum]
MDSSLFLGKDGHHADQVHRGEGNSDNRGILSSSYASVLNDKISTPKVTIHSLRNNEVVQGTNLAIPFEEVEEVFVEKKVEGPPKKTPRITGIWSARKADSPKRNVAFSSKTKVHHFDREDIQEVEHENAYSKKS